MQVLIGLILSQILNLLAIIYLIKNSSHGKIQVALMIYFAGLTFSLVSSFGMGGIGGVGAITFVINSLIPHLDA